MISLRSNIVKKVLQYFMINPQARHYVNELGKILNVDPKNLHTKLLELECVGLLKSEFQGKQRYFFLNDNYLLLNEYKKIIAATLFEPRLKEILSSVNGLKEVYLFGSYAKNTIDASSDIDVLAIGDHSTLELQKKINELQKEIGREINVVSMSEKDLAERRKKDNAFIRRIFSEKPIKIL